MNGWSSQIWILLLSSSGRPAQWDGLREWKREYELCVCVCVCVCVCAREPMVCGSLDKGAAGQCWQVKPMWYSVTALSERVIARQPGHLKIKETISPSLNPLPPSLPPTHHAAFHPSSVSPLPPNPALFPSNSVPLFVHPPLSSKSSLSLPRYLQLHYVSLKVLSVSVFLSLSHPLFFTL